MTHQRIDLETLSELKEMLEEEFTDLIETYISDTQAKVEQISEFIEKKDAPEVRRLAHSMKGSSVNLGINHLGDICHQLENEAASGNDSNFTSHFEKISSEVTWVISELEGYTG